MSLKDSCDKVLVIKEMEGALRDMPTKKCQAIGGLCLNGDVGTQPVFLLTPSWAVYCQAMVPTWKSQMIVDQSLKHCELKPAFSVLS